MNTIKTTTLKYILTFVLTMVASITFITIGPCVAAPNDNFSKENGTTILNTDNGQSSTSFLERLKVIPANKRIAQQEFRQWANEAKPFGKTALLCVFIAVIGLGFFPRVMEISQNAVRTSFWRCLGRALVTNVSLLILFRVFVGAKATVPLSILLIGLTELLLLAGLAVSICLFGNQIAKRTGIQNLSFIKSRPKIGHLISISIGSILMALLVQIPELGQLPPIGTRLAVLIATVGEGGLLVYLFCKPKS